MAGLADILGFKANPFLDWTRSHSNTLMGLGAGIASGTNLGQGVANGLQLAAQGKQADTAAETARKEELQKQAQLNYTIESMRKAGREDLVQMAQAGYMDKAFDAYLKSVSPGSTDYPAEYDLYKLTQSDPAFGEYLQQQGGGANAPSGYQYVDGQLAPIPGGPADPSNPLNTKRVGGPMSPTTQKELFEADDAAKAGDYVLSALDEAQTLNDSAYDGPMADVRGDTTALFGDQAGVATSRLKNVTTELALSQLKTIFGSMPTEGERKILLELQGSVNQPKQVRAAIYKRAKEMAERRIADNKAKAGALRSGAYFEEGYGAAPAGNQTSTGVTWSIDP